MATNKLNGTRLTASISADSVQASLDFYAALGFDVSERMEENGVLLGAMINAGDVQFGISQDDGKKGTNREKGVGMRLYVETTDDIDALAARAQAAGANVTKPPYDTEWKTRAFDAVDPSGFLITISSPESK